MNSEATEGEVFVKKNDAAVRIIEVVKLMHDRDELQCDQS